MTGITRILVPTDFSATADAALDYAFMLADRFGASLQLLHVLDDPFVADGMAAEAYITEAPVLRTAMLHEAQEKLAHRANRRQSGIPRIDTEVLFGHGARTNRVCTPVDRQHRRAPGAHRSVPGVDRSSSGGEGAAGGIRLRRRASARVASVPVRRVRRAGTDGEAGDRARLDRR